MSIKIEPLDNYIRDNDVNVLIGKNTLIKFVPKNTIIETELSLQTLLKTTDLIKSKLLNDVMNIKKLSKEIIELLGNSLKIQEQFLNVDFNNDKEFNKYILSRLEKIKDGVIKLSDQIKIIEREKNYYPANHHTLYFCNKCLGYQADTPETLPINCKYCNNIIENEIIIINARFLDVRVIDYLEGLWFEDYIAKLFIRIHWKTWCHGMVMGSTGIDHQIDILSINKLGYILVAECKSGNFTGKDIMNFAAKYFDIKSSFGFFFSLKEAPSTEKNYMNRTPGLGIIDNLENSSDQDIIDKINKQLNIG